MNNLNRKIVACVICAFTVVCVYGQKLHKENPILVGLFQDLDSMFPKRYLVRQNRGMTTYNLNYYFKDAEDKVQYEDTFKSMFAQLDKIRALHKYVETIDTVGIQLTKYVMSVYSDNPGQIDYVLFEVGDKKLGFNYVANIFGDENTLPSGIRYEDEIYKGIEELYNMYIHRDNVQDINVTYESNNNGRFFVTWDKMYMNRQVKAVKYVVPNCTQEDYKRFYDLFQEYMRKYDVCVASNDVFWEYEETGLAFVNKKDEVVCFGAALKDDGTLCLIKSEGGNLPRLWAEGNINWDYNCKIRSAYYKTPNNVGCLQGLNER